MVLIAIGEPCAAAAADGVDLLASTLLEDI